MANWHLLSNDKHIFDEYDDYNTEFQEQVLLIPVIAITWINRSVKRLYVKFSKNILLSQVVMQKLMCKMNVKGSKYLLRVQLHNQNKKMKETRYLNARTIIQGLGNLNLMKGFLPKMKMKNVLFKDSPRKRFQNLFTQHFLAASQYLMNMRMDSIFLVQRHTFFLL